MFNFFMKIILLQSALGLPFDKAEVKGDDDNTGTEAFDESSDYYYNTEVEKADSSISFAGNAEEALLKVLSEKSNDISDVNIGELFDNLIASQESQKTTSIAPAVFFSSFINSLTKESIIILLLTPFLFLFLTSISAMVAVPTLLFGLSLMSGGNLSIDKMSTLDSLDYIPEPLALPTIENIADDDYVNSDGSEPRLWQRGF